MDTELHNYTFLKIAVKNIPWEIIVVCEGLYVWATIFITILFKKIVMKIDVVCKGFQGPFAL